MTGYAVLACILTFWVDFFLLIGTSRLCGHTSKLGRCAMGALVGAVYAGGCVIPGFHFLGNPFWHVLFTAMVGWAAFGSFLSSVPCVAVYGLLHMAVNGILGSGTKSLLGTVLAGVGVFLLSNLGLPHRGGARYVPVELSYGDRHLKLTALRDTGNMLFDPVSGQSVLVVGADAAQQLTGLTREQLRQPVETMGSIPGLRLIPYKTIANESGFLLGLRLGQVQIGSRRGSHVVAFAPECLGSEGTYQALTGGMV